MRRPLFLMLVISIAFFTSCISDDGPTPLGAFDQGILVINEGNFNAGNGSLSFIQQDSIITNDIFYNANNEMGPGDVVQSAHETDQFIFIMVNNSSVIYALDKQTFEIVYEITDVQLPRYMTHLGNVGYVTEWVDVFNPVPGKVTSFDLASGEIIGSVEIGMGAEYPLIKGDDLFVSNNFDASISVIDLTTFTVSETIITAPSPGFIMADSQNELWVICGGGFTPNFAPANNGALQRITGTEVTLTVDLEQNVATKMAINPERNKLYFYTGNNVWSMGINESSSTQVFSDRAVSGFYGIGISPSGALYLTDAKGFQGAGEVIKYEPDGSRSYTSTAGIGPGFLLFR